LDYVTYFSTLRSFSDAGRLGELYDALIQLPVKLTDVTLSGRFLENHDQPRFAGLVNDTGLRQNAFVFNVLSDAIPIVYYGQESFLTGGNDPLNREALWDYGYTGNDLIKTLNKVRSIAISKDPKFATTLSTYLHHDEFQIFYQKGQLLVGLNGQSKQRDVSPYDLTIQGTKYTAGELLIEVLSCQSVTAGAGEVVVNMREGAPVVLLPRTALTGSGVCNL